MSATVLTSIGALTVSAIGVVFGYVSSTKANRPAESNAQLAWVKQAQDEATDARNEAREAKAESTASRAESAAARTESELTRQQQVKLRREFDAMQDWVDRVVRARDAYVAEHPLDQIEDSGVIRMMRAINGGPHLAGE